MRRIERAEDDMREGDKPNLLYVLHADFAGRTAAEIGGTQLHVKELALGLAGLYSVFVMTPGENAVVVTAHREGREPLRFSFPLISEPGGAPLRSEERFRLYREILRMFHIALVHSHHAMHISLEMAYAASDLGVPVIATMHDLYSLCPNYTLLDADSRYCAGNMDQALCGACLAAKRGIPNGAAFLADWRAETGAALSLCERIIAPSESCAELLLRAYPALSGKTLVIPHGDRPLPGTPDTREARKKGDPLNVAFLGGMSREKGSEIALRLAKRGAKDVRYHVFGGINDPELERFSAPNLIKTGWYERGELRALFARYRIDLAILPSLCPESFCYTLSEAVLLGVPVIVTDRGALNERVTRMGCGWVVSADDAENEISELLDRLKTDIAEYARARDAASRAELKPLSAMLRDYARLYSGVLGEAVPQAYTLDDLFACAQASSRQAAALRERLNASENRILDIERSFEYRLAGKIRIPFRAWLKKRFAGK